MQTKTGIITSNKMQKTLVIQVTTYKAHPKYKKRFRISKKFYAHCNDSSQYKVGDAVTFEATRPLSRLKRWKVVKNPLS